MISRWLFAVAKKLDVWVALSGMEAVKLRYIFVSSSIDSYLSQFSVRFVVANLKCYFSTIFRSLIMPPEVCFADSLSKCLSILL